MIDIAIEAVLLRQSEVIAAFSDLTRALIEELAQHRSVEREERILEELESGNVRKED